MGAIVNEMSIDAWGCRRNSSNWTYSNPSGPRLFSRGYTGHEHLDAFNLINMNGRVYDPMLGRFLSPDVVVQDPFNSQSYNRYSYCLNNPLIYVDINGYTWLSNFGDWIGNNWKPILTTVAAVTAAVLVTVITAGTMGPVAVAFLASATGGFVGNALGTALNGGNFGQCLVNGVLGGITGGTLGVLGFGIGLAAPASLLWGTVYNIATGGTLGGLMSKAQGGNFWTGFGMGAGFSSLGGFIRWRYANKAPNPKQAAQAAQAETKASTNITQAEEEAAGSDLYSVEEGSTEIPEKLYHYTPEDPSTWQTIGKAEWEDNRIWLTPDGELSSQEALSQLALKKAPNWKVEINTTDPSFDPSRVLYIQKVGQLFGQSGGGIEVVYKGPLDISNTMVKITRLP